MLQLALWRRRFGPGFWGFAGSVARWLGYGYRKRAAQLAKLAASRVHWG